MVPNGFKVLQKCFRNGNEMIQKMNTVERNKKTKQMASHYSSFNKNARTDEASELLKPIYLQLLSFAILP
jgi:hypothetical protein